jgi:hypothetical protein
MEVSGRLHASYLTPGGKPRGTHWIGGWVGPRADLEAAVGKGRVSAVLLGSEHNIVYFCVKSSFIVGKYLRAHFQWPQSKDCDQRCKQGSLLFTAGRCAPLPILADTHFTPFAVSAVPRLTCVPEVPRSNLHLRSAIQMHVSWRSRVRSSIGVKPPWLFRDFINQDEMRVTLWGSHDCE